MKNKKIFFFVNLFSSVSFINFPLFNSFCCGLQISLIAHDDTGLVFVFSFSYVELKAASFIDQSQRGQPRLQFHLKRLVRYFPSKEVHTLNC